MALLGQFLDERSASNASRVVQDLAGSTAPHRGAGSPVELLGAPEPGPRVGGSVHTRPMEPMDGTFWQIDTPERHTPGNLVVGGDDAPALETEAAIFIERQFKVLSRTTTGSVIAHSGDPEDLVADFEERTIHGDLADGRPVTLVQAQGGTRRLGFLRDPSQGSQQFRARYAVIGELVTVEQLYQAIRFRVVGPSWWGAAEDDAQTSDGGRLRFYRDDEGARWFEFTPSVPMTFGDLDSGVINAVTTLTQLATMGDAADAGVHVRLEADGPWRDVHRGRDSVEDSSRPLLGTEHLTAERFATWIDFRRETQGLDAAVLDELPGVAIQTHVVTLASVAEGLHRRLFGSAKRRVESLSNNKIAAMRRAAREAALTKMEGSEFTDDDRAEFTRAVSEAFGHINDQTFRSRMDDMLADAQRAIPSLGAAFDDWSGAVTMARNLMAHQPALPDGVDPDQFLDLLIALSYSIAWVLRTNLLVKARFDPATLRQGYGDSSSYGHHLANTRVLLAGSPWAAKAN